LRRRVKRKLPTIACSMTGHARHRRRLLLKLVVEIVLGQSEGEDVVTLFCAKLAVPSGGNHHVLLAFDDVGHGRGLTASGKFVHPHFLAVIGIEGAEVIVHGRGGKN